MILLIIGLFGIFLSAIGALFILSPASAAQAFGVDPSHMADLPMVPAIGARELVIGLIIMALAARRQKSALGIVLVLTALMPLTDYWIAAKAFGTGPAIKHLALAPISFVLGLILVWQ